MYPTTKYEKDLIRKFKKNRGCFYPGCSSKKSDVIQSHTMQKSGNLLLIADESNHVYQYRVTTTAFRDFEKYGFFSPTKIGVNRASTFPGFCAYHDKQLFKEIEDHPLIPTILQINLLAFRSLCSELYRKTAAVESKDISDAILNQSSTSGQSDRATIQHYHKVMEEGTKKGQFIMESAYDRLWGYVQDETTPHLDYLLLILDQIPQVLCSTCISPERDFDNNVLQILATEEEAGQSVYLNIFIQSGIGYVLYSWDKNHTKMEDFVSSLVSQNDIINTSIALVFSYSENHVFSVAWWESLKNYRKKDIFGRVLELYHIEGFKSPMKYGDWTFSAKTTSKLIEEKLIEKGILIVE